MIKLTKEPINTEVILQNLEDKSTGGVVLFLGKVRDHANNKAVTKMDYDAYPKMAEGKLAEVEAETQKRWPVKKISIVHRYGSLELGDVSVAVAVACAHRKDAFEACRFAIDTLKATVPIWKKEYFKEGSGWVDGVMPTMKQARDKTTLQ